MRLYLSSTLRILTLLTVFALSFVPASAQQQAQFGVFSVRLNDGGRIYLSGEIGRSTFTLETVTGGTALDFRRALAFAPSARILVLNSPGGNIDTTVLMLLDISERGMSTLIPAGASCFSACSILFMAGIDRLAVGTLGVHQLAGDVPGAATLVQQFLSIVSTLIRDRGIDYAVLTRMMSTRPSDMYVFSPEEIRRYGIDHPGATFATAAPAPADQKVPRQFDVVLVCRFGPLPEITLLLGPRGTGTMRLGGTEVAVYIGSSLISAEYGGMSYIFSLAPPSSLTIANNITSTTYEGECR